MLTTRAKQARAVWAVLRKTKGYWITTKFLAREVNWYRHGQWPRTPIWGTAAITARVRDFRKPKHGGHDIRCENRPGQGWSYRLIR